VTGAERETFQGREKVGATQVLPLIPVAAFMGKPACRHVTLACSDSPGLQNAASAQHMHGSPGLGSPAGLLPCWIHRLPLTAAS
jgi:hypothetical protein